MMQRWWLVSGRLVVRGILRQVVVEIIFCQVDCIGVESFIDISHRKQRDDVIFQFHVNHEVILLAKQYPFTIHGQTPIPILSVCSSLRSSSKESDQELNRSTTVQKSRTSHFDGHTRARSSIPLIQLVRYLVSWLFDPAIRLLNLALFCHHHHHHRLRHDLLFAYIPYNLSLSPSLALHQPSRHPFLIKSYKSSATMSTPNLITITSPDQFRTTLSEDLNRVSVLNFWASWAAPCEGMNKVIEEASGKYKSVLFLQVRAVALWLKHYKTKLCYWRD